MSKLVYLDNNATTKIDPRVLGAMTPYLIEDYANASSTHSFGLKALEAIKFARIQVANLIGSLSSEIIFTSCATESINLALKGIIPNKDQKNKHVVTTVTEHPAVLDTCKYLEGIGYKVTYLPVEKNGILNLETLKKSLRDYTFLVSVMFVNNETGVVQPIKEIAEIAHASGTLFMTDATQAVGKVTIDVNALGIDIMAFSGHKFYGPKGVGGLFVRNQGPNKVKLQATQHGGGQENGIRSGTLNVPGIVGLGKAAEIAQRDMESDSIKVRRLRNYLEQELLKLEDTFLNGDRVIRLYNVSNICFKQIDANVMIGRLKNIAISNGSACATSSLEPSHVLKAMGLSDDNAFSSIRFSFGRFNTKEEILFTVKEIVSLVRELRSHYPLSKLNNDRHRG